MRENQNEPRASHVTQPVLRPVGVAFLVKAQGLNGREIEPIRCSTVEEAEDKIALMRELGFLSVRIRAVRTEPKPAQ